MPKQPSSHEIHAENPPSSWVWRHASLLSRGGHVLDLAAGSGRHTHLLLKAGFRVTAVDRDVTALAAAFAGNAACRIVACDLESGASWSLGDGYDGIVVTNYLHRPLLPQLAAALAPNGLLIYETFMLGNERFGKPSNPDFLLKPNELADTFAPMLTLVAFEQGIVQTPRPAAIQRMVAVKGPILPLN